MTEAAPFTVHWAIGIALVLLGAGMGFFYWLAARQESLSSRLIDIERALSAFRETVANTYVRNDGLTALRAELTGQISGLRQEVRADAERAAGRAERAESEIQRQLAEIKDSMLRIIGDRRTRASD